MWKITLNAFALCLAFAFSSFPAEAKKTFNESAQIQFSSPLEKEKGRIINRYVIHYDSKTFVVKEERLNQGLFRRIKKGKQTDIYLVEYNTETLNPTGRRLKIYDHEEKTPDGHPLSSYFSLYQTKNAYVQIFDMYDRKARTSTQYVRTFSKNFEVTNKLKLINTTDYSKSTNPFDKATLNEDSTSLIWISQKKIKGERPMILKVCEISEDGEFEEKNEVEIPTDVSDFRILEMHISSSKKIVLVANITLKETTKKKEKINRIGVVYTFSREDDIAKEFFPEFSDTYHSVFGLQTSISAKEVKIIAFYDLPQKLGINGIINKTFDIEKEKWVVDKSTPFSSSMLSKIDKLTSTYSSTINVKNKGLNGNFEVINFFALKDGGSIMTSQFRTSYRICKKDKNGIQQCKTVYIYGDYLIFKFDQNGNLLWFNVISKYVKSDDLNYVSFTYSMWPTANGVTVYMNDLSLNAKGYAKSCNGSRFLGLKGKYEEALVTFSDEGKPKIKTVIPHNENAFYLMDYRGINLDDKTLMFQGRFKSNSKKYNGKKGDYFFAKVTY